MTSIVDNPILARLNDSHSVIVAGAGGGFDVLAGIPLALALRARGMRVTLANSSFADLATLPDSAWIAPGVAAVTPSSGSRQDYFPEHVLSQWLESISWSAPVYAFARAGVQPLSAAYRELVKHVGADAVLLVDGGTDILMFGDESGLGTPEEDVASLASVASLEIDTKLVASIGFGIDSFHGVDHTQVLENIATLQRDGAYLGAFAVPAQSDEGSAFLDAVRYCGLSTKWRPSIVNGQIAAAIAGDFGNVQFTRRTSESELFVNALMGIYFCFELEGIARRNLYLDRLSDTVTIAELAREIEAFRDSLPRTRVRRQLPL